jgi:hypothetical protein
MATKNTAARPPDGESIELGLPSKKAIAKLRLIAASTGRVSGKDLQLVARILADLCVAVQDTVDILPAVVAGRLVFDVAEEAPLDHALGKRKKASHKKLPK